MSTRDAEIARRAECAAKYPVGTKLSNGIEIVEAPSYKDRVMVLDGNRAEIEIDMLAALCDANGVTIL